MFLNIDVFLFFIIVVMIFENVFEVKVFEIFDDGLMWNIRFFKLRK